MVVGLVLGVFAGDAAAWGPRAQQAIAAASIQLVRKSVPSAFKTDLVNYEEDILRGALMGPGALQAFVPLNSEREALAAVGSEIQLMREVKLSGIGSYACYRMGIISALVADLVLPYGMAWSKHEAELQARIESDIDKAVDSYRFDPAGRRRQFIRDPEEYFARRRGFYEEDKKMIADDYARGEGFGGFLAKGGEAYFGRAIEAVTDAWYTMLRTEEDFGDSAPTQVVLSRYFLSEVAYLLNQKRNIYQADKAYEHFAAANPGLMNLYEEVGDLYYAYGTEAAKERGVREWRIAFSHAGPHRESVASKLANHYRRVGEAKFEHAFGPTSREEDLREAREAIQTALEFEPSRQALAQLLNDVNVAIAEREERRQLAVDIVAAAEKVMKEADRLRMDGKFSDAIRRYNDAVGLFGNVSDEFDEQNNAAKNNVKQINLRIREVINTILDRASDKITEGEEMLEGHRWDDAAAAFQQAKEIVKDIPEGEAAYKMNKENVITEAERKLSQVEERKQRYEEDQRRRAAAAAAAQQAATQPQ